MEDESLTIGRRTIPRTFWNGIQTSVLFDVQAPVEFRVRALTEEYGSLDRDFLVECTVRIRKRLGPEQTQRAVAAIQEGRMEDFIREVLVYYDKTYRTALRGRDPARMVPVPVRSVDPAENTERILRAAGSISLSAGII